MSKFDLTIAICAYNAAGRLAGTLGALARQHMPPDLRWELIVIDNNSTDETSRIANKLGSELKLPIRVIVEPQPGLNWARRRAAVEAGGEFLSYVDDDNLVEPDWLSQCVAFMRSHPKAGIIGGRVDPIFEDPASRPADFDEKFANALAVRDFGPEPQRLVPPEQDPPCGAGMTGRTHVLRHVLVEIGCRLSDRKGHQLTSGGDSEIGLLVHHLGWEMWYAPTLRMGHVLPASRLTQAYLDRLIAHGAQSDAWLDYLRGKEPKKSRLGYFNAWRRWRQASMKMRLLNRLRGRDNPNAERFEYWADFYQRRSQGYWELAMRYPFSKLTAAIQAGKAVLSEIGFSPAGRTLLSDSGDVLIAGTRDQVEKIGPSN